MSSRQKIVLQVGTVVVFVAIVVFRSSLSKTDPLALRVEQLLAVGNTPDIRALQELGPGIIPHLGDLAKEDSPISKGYKFVWAKLSLRARTYFPQPKDRIKMRRAAMQVIAELGPLAARGAVPAVIAGVNDPDATVQRHALYANEWLVPEKPKALAAFRRRLGDTNQPPPGFSNLTVSEYLWARTPGLLPLVTNWLCHPRYAYEAAIALRYMGSNAAPAIPLLIQALERGVAGGVTDSEAARWYQSGGRRVRVDDNEWHHNRAMAAQALGAIGSFGPEGRAALTRAWTDSNTWVRFNAVQAIGEFGPSATNVLPQLLAGLRDRDNRTLGAKFAVVGKLGPPALAAIEILEEFTDPGQVRYKVDHPDLEVVSSSVKDLAAAAKMAICRISPERGKTFLPDIFASSGHWWEPVVFLHGLKPCSREIIALMEPALQATNARRCSIAAYVILGHDPTHVEARTALEKNKTEGTVNDRMHAGRLLFETLGITNDLCGLIDRGLAPESEHGQTAAYLGEKIGSAAMPSLPSMKQALWHKDKFTRTRVGVLLRKLAPEELELRKQ